MLLAGRRQRQRFGFPLRPVWAEGVLGGARPAAAMLGRGLGRQFLSLADTASRSSYAEAQRHADARRRR